MKYGNSAVTKWTIFQPLLMCGLEDSKDLESLKGLKSLKVFESLKGLESLMC